LGRLTLFGASGQIAQSLALRVIDDVFQVCTAGPAQSFDRGGHIIV
jgi:hypothetical protein